MRLANIALLSFTFIASVTLLAIVQQRKLLRRLSLFVALITLYILRAAVLFVGLRLFDRSTYLQVESVSSLFDLVLQLALAYSLARKFTQSRLNTQHFAGSKLLSSALFLFASCLLVSGILTLLLVSVFPSYAPVPLDRGVVFSGLVFLLLVVFVRQRSEGTAEGRIFLGFCIASMANILSQCGRTLAATRHDPRTFLIWAYANSIVWIGVLVFWILRLQVDSSADREVPDGAFATVK